VELEIPHPFLPHKEIRDNQEILLERVEVELEHLEELLEEEMVFLFPGFPHLTELQDLLQVVGFLVEVQGDFMVVDLMVTELGLEVLVVEERA
jgi:hypothetical protein